MTASSKTRTILRLANRAIRHISRLRWILALTARREASRTFRRDSGLAVVRSNCLRCLFTYFSTRSSSMSQGYELYRILLILKSRGVFANDRLWSAKIMPRRDSHALRPVFWQARFDKQ